MKKIISLCIITALLAASCIGAAAKTATIPSIALADDLFLYKGSPLENDNSTAAARNNVTLDSGISFSEYSGFVDTVDDLGKGTSLRVGITEERNSSNNISVNIPIPGSFYTTGESGSCVFEMDVYIDSKTDFAAIGKPYGNATFYTQFYGPTSNLRKRALVWDQKLYTKVDAANELSTEEGFDYEEKKWYKVRIELNWVPEGSNFIYTYDAYASLGENDEMVQLLDDESAMRGASKVTQIRFYSPILKSNPAWAAIDNVLLTSERKMPEISSIMYEDAEGNFSEAADGEVSHQSSVIALNLTGRIKGVNEGDVLLYSVEDDMKTAVAISKTEYDEENQRIIITLQDKLLQRTNYEVWLTESIEAEEGVFMPEKQSAEFITTEEPIVHSIISDNGFLYGGAPFTASAPSKDVMLDSGLIVSKYTGFAESFVMEGFPDREEVLKLGISESGESLPSVNIPVSSVQSVGSQGSLKLEYDFYINEKTSYENVSGADKTNGAFRLSFYGAGNKTALYWDQILLDNYGGAEYEYNEKTWYKAALELSWVPNGNVFDYTFNAYIGEYDGNTLNENEMVLVAGNKQIKDQTSAISQIRLYVPKTVESEKWIAFDNITLSETRDVPDITGFGANGVMTGAAVDVNTDIVEVYLNSAILGVTEKDVVLSENNIPIDILKVGYDGAGQKILIKLKDKLKDNTAYTVTLLPDIKMWETMVIGRKRTSEFTTTTNGVLVNDIVVTPEENGDVKIEATASNVSGESENVYFIASVWNQNKFIKQKVIRVSTLQGSSLLSVTVDGVNDGDTIYVYAWDKVFGAKMLTSKIMSYEK